MEVTARLYRELEANELADWERLVAKAYPPTDEVRLGSDLSWAELEPATDYFVGLRDDGELRACAWVTQRTVAIDGEERLVAGIRGVVTDPDCRRSGYGRAVMEYAHVLMQSFPCELALLFSSEMAVPFYESLGWRAVAGPVTCEQPDGTIDYTATLPPTAPVMVLPLRPGAEIPDGPIEVRGLPW